MAKEYIEREAAISAVHKAWAKGLEPTQYIEDIPAADVVEVVRCNDCKHFGTDNCALDTYLWDVIEDGFCSYGERRGSDG